MNDSDATLDDLVARLERAAEQLRSGDLSADAAATVVEDCAALASQASAELERRAREAERAPLPGQDSLLQMVDSVLPHLESDSTTQVPYPDELRLLVEHELERLTFSAVPGVEGLVEAMRYSLLAGGKRIRPVLALATARAIGRDEHELLPLAAALELIHTYSLIHDDLPAMDDDAMRRGRPTAHVAFGEDVAILAGDALYAEAFHHVLAEQRGEPRHVLAAMAELAAATGVDGMVGGQYLDVAGEQHSAEQLRRLHGLKTGRLIRASVECVLLIDGMTRPETSDYCEFASELGVLFQIVDDILDVTGTEADLGKPQGSDERHGKRTYVSEFGLDGARELARRSHRQARERLAAAAPGGAPELEQITDFIATRTS